MARDLFADPDFKLYIDGGIEAVPSKAKDSVVQGFSSLPAACNVISFQQTLGYIKDPEWALFKAEFRAVVTRKGAHHCFERRPINKSSYDKKFIDLM